LEGLLNMMVPAMEISKNLFTGFAAIY